MTKTDILIDTSFHLKNKTGVGFFILNLLRSMQNINMSYKKLELYIPQCFKFKIFFEMIWLNTYLHIYTIITKPKALINPAFLCPILQVRGVKYISVIHDLAFYRDNETTTYHKFIHKFITEQSLRKATQIVTVSDTIRNEIINKFNINKNKIKVIYNSVPEHFYNTKNNNEILNKYNLTKQKYVLSVATLNKRKNIPALVQAFEKISDKYPDLKLVLVGGMGNEDRKILTNHPNIVFTGYIKDEELPTLYKNALLYMYPSLYEGFGIPLIEAQYCGCPVLCSDIPVFREIGANSVEYCEPTTVGIANGLEYLINNSQRLQELSELGKENVKRFSIEKITEQLKDVIISTNKR